MLSSPEADFDVYITTPWSEGQGRNIRPLPESICDGIPEMIRFMDHI